MSTMAQEPSPETKSPIQQFFSGQNVFITGGTGFLGKALIEKLLRACHDIGSVYILIRPKRKDDVSQRIDKLFEDPIFARLKKEKPKFLHKVIAVAGDCTLPGLGLSASDLSALKREINIVFHGAATVRFDEKLHLAIPVNVGATKEILELCKSMNNLRVAIHVSTAYSNCIHKTIQEKFYDPPIRGENAIQLAKCLDSEKLDAITDVLLENFPNTYTYTKCIAEGIVREYGNDLPVGVFRPAMVLASYKEPVEGWTDNIYGPMGPVAGVGTGLMRVVFMESECNAEMVPVDRTVNALIATAWDVANNKNEQAEPPIYNYHSSWDKNFLTWGRYSRLALKYGKQVPTVNAFWCYISIPVRNYYLYCCLIAVLHFLPALFADMCLFLMGKKPWIVKLYRKIHKFSVITAYFSMRKWEFTNRNTVALWSKLDRLDQELFTFAMSDFDWEDFMYRFICGARVYIFKDDPSTLPQAKRRMFWFLTAHRIIKYGMLALTAWTLYRIVRLFVNAGIVSTILWNKIPIVK